MRGHAAFLLYCLAATAVILYLIVRVAPAHGNSNIFVYLAICSLIGSLSVMSVKVRPAPCTALLRCHLLPRERVECPYEDMLFAAIHYAQPLWQCLRAMLMRGGLGLA